MLEVCLRMWFFHSLLWPNATLPSLSFSPDPVLGWRTTPNQVAGKDRLEFRGIIRINSKGLRDEEHSYEPAPSVFRIVLLGDSFMQGTSVDYQDSLPFLLEQALADKRVQVINCGVEGYSLVQELLFLKMEGTKYHPDLVLVAMYAENDVADSALCTAPPEDGETKTVRPYARRETDGRLVFTEVDVERLQKELDREHKIYTPFELLVRSMRRSMTSRVYKLAIGRFRQKLEEKNDNPNLWLGVHAEVFNPALCPEVPWSSEEYKRRWEEAWRVTERTLEEIKAVAEGSGSPLAVFSVPSKLQVESRYLDTVKRRFPGMEFDLLKAERRLQAICSVRGIPFLGLVETFRDAAAEGHQLFYQIDDAHWNAAGHRLAAQETAQWLRDQTLVREARQNGPSSAVSDPQ